METYLLKTILCSSVFIGFYYLILERQKAHQFKRFYLLFSMLFSMLISFLSITYGVEKPVTNDIIFIENSDAVFVPVVEETSVFTLENIVYTVYFIVTFGLFTRFLISLNALRKEINSGTKIKRGNYFLVLKEEKSTAHSFWKYIFLNKTDFENGKIDDKIIRHEEVHLQQKHSFDVLFMEFLLTIFWFNPAFYLYKKAMITNHEFLADEAVLKNENDIKSYQKLLLTELISERILFTNPFNLSNTKKRIKMMTTPKNNKSKLFPWLSLPLAAVVFFAFVEKVPAQLEKTDAEIKPQADSAAVVNLEKLTNEERKMIESKTIGIKWDDAVKMVESKNAYEEFQKILSKYSNLLEQKKYAEFERKITSEDKKKLMLLYHQLTDDQQNSLPLAFVNLNKKLPKISPENNQLEDFQNSQKYGVWIDGKKVSNSTLKNYSKGDFSQVFVSKVHKNAQNSKNPQPFQVNLMTNKYYEEYLAKKGSTVLAFKGSAYSSKLQDTIKSKSNQNQELPPPPPPIDVPAEFPGGMSPLRSKVMNNFNTSLMKGDEGKLTAEVYLDIDERGNASNYTVEGSSEVFRNEALRSVQVSTENVVWKPATKYGKPVKSRYKLPLTMFFEK